MFNGNSPSILKALVNKDMKIDFKKYSTKFGNLDKCEVT